LATNRNWTTETGKKREEPEYHRLVAWDRQAEFCSKYLCKGRKVYVEGRLQTRSFTAKDGKEKSATEIVVDDLLLLDPMPEAVREALEFQKPQ
jgi:single-strand DNA-binding protein